MVEPPERSFQKRARVLQAFVLYFAVIATIIGRLQAYWALRVSTCPCTNEVRAHYFDECNLWDYADISCLKTTHVIFFITCLHTCFTVWNFHCVASSGVHCNWHCQNTTATRNHPMLDWLRRPANCPPQRGVWTSRGWAAG